LRQTSHDALHSAHTPRTASPSLTACGKSVCVCGRAGERASERSPLGLICARCALACLRRLSRCCEVVCGLVTQPEQALTWHGIQGRHEPESATDMEVRWVAAKEQPRLFWQLRPATSVLSTSERPAATWPGEARVRECPPCAVSLQKSPLWLAGCRRTETITVVCARHLHNCEPDHRS
jgi:hypothetical protein